MTWATPYAFLLLFLLAVVVIWVFYNRRKRRPSLQFSNLTIFERMPQSLRAKLVIVPYVLKLLALAVTVFALARPQRADTKIKRNVEGIDIMVVLDISDSMLIEDMLPENRLESSKQTISEFIKGRVSDRIGLVVFSGESYTRVPLTLDYPLLLQSVKDVQVSRNIKMGTAIGVALANGVARLRESVAKSRVVILLTDGENNSGTIDPETALDIAKGYGIRIYTIGAGKDGQAQLPILLQDANGQTVKRYRPIHSKVNDELLGRMAEQTGGKYWRAETTDALKGVFNAINDLEKTKIETSSYTKYAELFPPFVEWAMLLYIVSILLGRTVLRRGP